MMVGSTLNRTFSGEPHSLEEYKEAQKGEKRGGLAHDDAGRNCRVLSRTISSGCKR